MAVIRANRESIDDRFSVLGFTVRSELPLYEIAVATEPELLRPDQRARRNARNFFTSRLQRVMASQRGESVYLVPPDAVARFIGQSRLYFGLATYRESDRSVPVSLRLPDRGTMYVGLAGLSERGFRRSLRGAPASTYGSGGPELGWGGDAATQPAPPSRDEDRAPVPANGARAAAPAAGGAPAPYSDGYSDDLWKQPAAPAPATAAPPAATTAPAPTAQGLAYRGNGRATARSLLISSDYHPSNFWDALRAQVGFFVDSAMWYLGVADTTVMPHAAICQIRRPDGTEEGALHGSGFFIGPRLILTAAHVVDGQSELIVVPGKNGGGIGGATEPFGRFRVTTFRKHDRYGTNGSDFDMGLICVPAANAVGAGQYFDLVEELTQSRPEGVVVSGYAARWYANDAIEHFVNDTIDPNKQHMMGGYIRALPTDETFSYNIQTLGGTSGSPVYWIEDAATGPRAHMVGVHVAAHDATTNLGCRITAQKLAWIRQVASGWGQTVSFSLGTRGARALSVEDDDAGHDIGAAIPDAPASAAQGWSGARGLTLTAPEYPQASRFEPADPGNYRAVTGTRTIDKVVIHITDGGANLAGPVSWFKNPAAKVSAHYVIGQDGTIVQMVAHNDVAWHAGSANGTSIGIEHVANTRGLNPTAAQMCASAALVTWLCDTYGIPADRQHILGHSEADRRTTHTGCPNAVWDWAYYMDMITTRTCYVPASIAPSTGLALGLGRARSLADDADADDPDAYGIGTDEPVEAEAMAQGLQFARGLTAETPDYPGASRFVAAATGNFRRGRRRGTTVDRIVIHITAGGPNLDGTVSWFRNPDAKVSAHYIVGRDGEVVQMVRDADTAYHASSANSRSIGIEHNGNKPSRRNRRDLPPTDRQYEESAKLVAWLCAQHGIPADRDHIVGHHEISPGDNHDCPTDYWDWDHYMACVAAAVAASSSAGAPAPTAQGLGQRGYSRAQELLTPFYDPSNPYSALTCTNDAFSQQREEWYVGVQDTSSFPHSAICFLRMTAPDGTAYTGTGFYIGRNRILTCAHNLHGMSTVQIVPGRNGAGTAPFHDATIDSSQWRVAPRYTGDGDWDNDLAVIDNAPIAAPNGAWFRFLQGTPATTMPLAVCGYSAGSNLHPELGSMTDRNRQHLHGGHAQGQATPETIDYDILAIAGASGSPVYTVRDDGSGLQAYVCGVHVTRGPIDPGTGGASVNRACFLTPAKLDWIEGRATSFSLGATARPLSNDGPSDYPVQLIPQPDKNACWAASMAMLIAHRRRQSRTPESIINEIGGSLATCYDWALLDAARDRYGFQAIPQPSNASIFHTPRRWAEWLNVFGPLWVVIVGAPHAVVVAGIRGNLDDANAVQVKILNPWDTRVAFDNDPVAFHPENRGYEDWLPFMDFAAAYGDMAEPDYGNWRILYLPAAAALTQSLGEPGRVLRLASPPPPIRALEAVGDRDEAIDPSRVAGTRMRRTIGEAGACRWSLDQLEGLKSPASPSMAVSSANAGDVRIALDDWPAIEGAPTPLPVTVTFRTSNGSLGDVRISAGTPANLAYGVDVTAKIEDCADADGVARLRVRVDYRFRGLAQGNPDATVDLTLRGDGRYERENGWRNADALSPAA